MPDVDVTEHTFDVLVIGAGGAGLRAAVEAAENGQDTAVVTKSLLGKAHTVMAEGGCAAALSNSDERDNWKVHFRDTVRGSKLLNDWRMAKIHAQEAPKRVRELEKWGALWDRTGDGWIHQRPFGGHEYPRLAHVGDRTGLEMIRTLQDKTVATNGLNVFQETTITRLFKQGDRVVGAFGHDRETGDFVAFNAKSVILACGGVGQSYRVSSNSWEYTGDGMAMAYDAGAELMDMEFVQFHPTGMIWPPSARGLLVTEGVRGEGGILRNSEGDRFMFDYVPPIYEGEFAEDEDEAMRWLEGDEDARRPPELLTRDVVAKAIRDEVHAGRGSPHGGAFLDISWRKDAYIERKLPSMIHQFDELAGLDIREEPMEVAPTMHYIMGGVRVDPETQETRVRGLFCCGENAAGLHGANRLGGNSISDLVVFGKRAGENAARFADEHAEEATIPEAELEAAIQDALAPLERDEGGSSFKVHEALQTLMHEHGNMIRTGEGLQEGLDKLATLKEDVKALKVDGGRRYNPGWHRALALESMVTVSEAILKGALAREESRGAHVRIDHEDKDDRWGKINQVITKGDDGEMTKRTEPMPERPPDVEDIIQATAKDVSTPREVTP